MENWIASQQSTCGMNLLNHSQTYAVAMLALVNSYVISFHKLLSILSPIYSVIKVNPY